MRVDIRRQINSVLAQHFAQIRVVHRRLDTGIDDIFAHVPRADPVIDTVMKPIAGIAQDCRHVRFAKP